MYDPFVDFSSWFRVVSLKNSKGRGGANPCVQEVTCRGPPGVHRTATTSSFGPPSLTTVRPEVYGSLVKLTGKVKKR